MSRTVKQREAFKKFHTLGCLARMSGNLQTVLQHYPEFESDLYPAIAAINRVTRRVRGKFTVLGVNDERTHSEKDTP